MMMTDSQAERCIEWTWGKIAVMSTVLMASAVVLLIVNAAATNTYMSRTFDTTITDPETGEEVRRRVLPADVYRQQLQNRTDELKILRDLGARLDGIEAELRKLRMAAPPD